MKYYLLTFNEDYGDEHDVPALACFTEEKYNKWLKTPSGKLNPKYQEQFNNYNNYKIAEKELNAKIEKELGKGWGSIQFTKWPKELLAEYNGLSAKFGFKSSYENYPKKCKSRLNAYLGNSGECFENSYEHLYLMEEFVSEGVVSVTEVDKSFFDVFHRAGLDGLSLCNVFDIDSLLEAGWDEDDENEEEE